MWSGRDRCHFCGFLLRIMPPSWHPVPACIPRQCCRLANPILATTAAGGLFFDAATKIGIGRGKCCRHGRCSRNHSSLRQRRIESDAEPRSRHGRCMRAILYRHNDCAASIRKSGPEIKNRCSPRAKSREKLVSIRKSGLEIKNRCTQKVVFGEILTSIPKFGPEIKNRCTQEDVNGHNVSASAITCPRYKKSRVCALLFSSPFVWEEAPVCFGFGSGRHGGRSVEYIRQVVEEVDAHLTA